VHSRQSSRRAKLAWVASYERGLSACRAREFARAVRFFEDALDNRSDDKASSNLVERCRALLATQPGKRWRPVTELSGK
jgi:adenylate cyclase